MVTVLKGLGLDHDSLGQNPTMSDLRGPPSPLASHQEGINVVAMGEQWVETSGQLWPNVGITHMGTATAMWMSIYYLTVTVCLCAPRAHQTLVLINLYLACQKNVESTDNHAELCITLWFRSLCQSTNYMTGLPAAKSWLLSLLAALWSPTLGPGRGSLDNERCLNEFLIPLESVTTIKRDVMCLLLEQTAFVLLLSLKPHKGTFAVFDSEGPPAGFDITLVFWSLLLLFFPLLSLLFWVSLLLLSIVATHVT